MVMTAEHQLATTSESLGGVDDLVTKLILLPNSLFCASVGAVVGGWLGALGLQIDGESQYFVRGALRGAMVFANTGWQIPNVILNQATGLQQSRLDYAPSAPPLRGPSLLQDPYTIQLYGSKLLELRQQHAYEIEKLKDVYEFHKKRAEDAIVAAAGVSARIAELQSFFELQEALMEKQILLMSRGRPARGPSTITRGRSEALKVEASQPEEDRRQNDTKLASAQVAENIPPMGSSEGASQAIVTSHR